MGPNAKYSPPQGDLQTPVLPSSWLWSLIPRTHLSLLLGLLFRFLLLLFVCFNLPPYLWFCPLTYPLRQTASTAQVPPGLSSREASPEQSPGSPAPTRGFRTDKSISPSARPSHHPCIHSSFYPLAHLAPRHPTDTCTTLGIWG